MSRRAPRAIAVTRALLRRLPLPTPDETGSKDERGQVLVVGGSTQVAGAVRLAGEAALRAGAGKLQLATVKSSAAALGMAVPESLVVALPESRRGEIVGARASAMLAQYVQRVDAMLVGPGMTSAHAAHALLAPSVGRLGPDAALILDAAAILALRSNEALLAPLDGRSVLTPHAGERVSRPRRRESDVSAIVAIERSVRCGDRALRSLEHDDGAEPFRGVKRRLSRLCLDGVLLHVEQRGHLAGIVAGLAARGAPPLNAVVWGVYLHGSAGRALAKRVGPLGFLARELLAELPPLLRRLG